MTGFANRRLRAHVASLLRSSYSANQMSHDLGRLWLHGVTRRFNDQHRYTLTPDGRRFAFFYTCEPRRRAAVRRR